MRLRLGLIFAVVMVASLQPISPTAHAFGGLASAPLSISQTAIAGGIRVSWSAPTDVDTGITGYRVEYSTSGTTGTWTLWATVGSSTFSSDILGLSQVATYVRVAANTSAGTGTYGYPWTKLYGVTGLNRNSSGNPIYETGYGVGASDPFTTKSSAAFTRIRWRVETTISGVAKYADADAYEWTTGDSTKSVYSYAPTVASVMVPSVNAPYAYSIQANVTDLNVYSDNSAVTNGRGLNGRLEIWPWDYSVGTSGLTGTGDANKYDYDDTNAGSSNYGSFQIHDMTNLKPVFSWNHQLNGAVADFGYGANPTGNPDWTFCYLGGTNGTCTTPSSFKLQIYVNIPVTPLADATPPSVSRIDSRFYVKNADTITVQSSELGTAYLVSQAVTVTNLASITAASTSSKISVSVSAANSNTTMTIGYQSNGLYNLYAADSAGNLSTAVLATIRIDNTAPTATSIAVGSSGTFVQLTANETITNSLQVFGMFSVTDSGSAISVNSVAVSGLTATLGLSRAIPAGATVYFTYTPNSGSAGGRIVDLSGNEMAPITSQPVTNNSSSPIAVTLTVPDPITKGVSTTASVSVSVAGKVTFTIAGKRIAGCLNKVATGTTPITVTCTFKPTLSANQTIAATLVPALSAYPNITSSISRFILKRSTPR